MSLSAEADWAQVDSSYLGVQQCNQMVAGASIGDQPSLARSHVGSFCN